MSDQVSHCNYSMDLRTFNRDWAFRHLRRRRSRDFLSEYMTVTDTTATPQEL